MRDLEIIAVLETDADYRKFLQDWKDPLREKPIRKCARCGGAVEYRNTICLNCKKKKRPENVRRCGDCGVEVGPKRWYCDTHAMARIKLSSSKWYKKRRKIRA